VLHRNSLADIVKALVCGGAIETARHRSNVQARGYRLAAKYLGDRCVHVSATDPRLIEAIERERHRQHEQDQQTRWLPIHHALQSQQYHVTLTSDADNILDALPAHTRLCQDVLASNIRRRELPFSVSSTGRVFNGITGLKRELRNALRIDGEHVGHVDIRCAQPALLAMLLLAQYPPYGPKNRETYKHTAVVPLPVLLSPLPTPAPSCLPADAGVFTEIASSGLLYERLMESTGLDRETLKRRVLVDVLAKRGGYPSTVEAVFRESFPSVYQIVRRVNRRDHGTLIRLLQRAESWLVVETVAPRLLGKVRIVTLHDAIFTALRQVPAVETAFREVFAELGFSMALKVERG